MPSLSLISMLSLFTLLLSLFSLMNASPIVSGPGSAAVGPAKLSMARRSSLDITEHSTGGTYDCAPRDIHCCEQTLGHTNENKAQKGGANGGGAGANGDGSGSGSNGSGSGSNVAKRSSSNPFENVLQMRDVVGNFGVNCSPLAIGAISTCKSAVMCCSDMSAEGKVNAECTPLGIA